MNFGPFRRSSGRLSSLDTSHSRSFATIDEATPYPGMPPKLRESRRVEYYVRSWDDKLLKFKSSWRRAPFFVWIVTVSLYCWFVYMRVGVVHRDLIKNNMNLRRFVRPQESPRLYKSTAPGEDKTTKPPLQEEEEKEQLEDSADNDGMNSGLFHSKYLRRPVVDPENSVNVQFTEIVHVVETRFMQQQSHLLELGFARLALFEAFCLPSMLSQTNEHFLWIIRADPDLHPSIVDRLQILLRGRQNFILIGSNNNPEGFGRPKPKLPFNLFLRLNNITAPVWNGNISLAEEAYERSAAGAVLLETRLDSDDGLNNDFIERVQKEARENLMIKNNNETEELWRLWCIESRIEWHPLSPFPHRAETAAANKSFPEGYLVYYGEKGCSTPGLTFGYGHGASRESINTALGISHLRHDEITKKIRICNKKRDDVEVGCVSRLTELKPGAVRARTTTSAGMSNVITGHRDIDKRNGFSHISKNKKFIAQLSEQGKFWAGLTDWLSVSIQDAQFARSIILGRMKEIALDNLKGQCTGGHSCKNVTQSILGRLAGG
ncbi:hypothetical protein ACHAXA_000118 [Cyclostephanos tholiformis]|uniref:Uncharacterized protein n=1 Tax=Cyclostephanos tholiformis TaxID=382380 RepID=A0ABD3RXY3_9STRA